MTAKEVKQISPSLSTEKKLLMILIIPCPQISTETASRCGRTGQPGMDTSHVSGC